jgi:hypothetical protein
LKKNAPTRKCFDNIENVWSDSLNMKELLLLLRRGDEETTNAKFSEI